MALLSQHHAYSGQHVYSKGKSISFGWIHWSLQFCCDTTFFACEKYLHSLINRLEHEFTCNWMVWKQLYEVESRKMSFSSIGNKFENTWAEIGHAKIWENPKQELLGVVIDRDLSFDGYLSSLFRKAGKKRSALARPSHYTSLKQRRVLMKSFIEAHFGYCQLIWMFHARELNRKINHIHERALRIVYRDNSSSFTELLKKDNSACIHYRNTPS